MATVIVDPEAAGIQEEKQQHEEEEEEEADVEEQERVDALLQRKKLLQDLGVVEQIQQLLQGRTAKQDARDTSQQNQWREQQTKVRTNSTVTELESSLWKIKKRNCFV